MLSTRRRIFFRILSPPISPILEKVFILMFCQTDGRTNIKHFHMIFETKLYIHLFVLVVKYQWIIIQLISFRKPWFCRAYYSKITIFLNLGFCMLRLKRMGEKYSFHICLKPMEIVLKIPLINILFCLGFLF